MGYETNLQYLGYEPLPRFAILDEHTFSNKKKAERFDKARLERLAAKLNRRASELDDLVPIIVGHTTDDDAEDDQPPIVGYGSDYRVERLGRSDKWALTACPWAAKGHKATFQKFPRRSVELWVDEVNGDDIDPIALLGATTPRRTLGVHLFSRKTAGIHYARTCEDSMNDDELDGNGAESPKGKTSGGSKFSPEDLDAITTAVMQSKPMMEVMSLVAEIKSVIEGEGDEHTDDGSGAPGAMPPPAAPGGDMPQGMPAGAPPGAMPPEDPKMAQYERGYAEEVIRMQRQLETRISQLERENAEMEIDAGLARLADKIEFDATEEKAALLRMSRKEQVAHITRMETRYARKSRPVPGGGRSLVGDAASAPVRFSRDAAPTEDEGTAALENVNPFKLAEEHLKVAKDGKTIEEVAIKLSRGNSTGTVPVR